MNRRTFVTAGLAAAAAHGAWAADKVWRIGWLGNTPANTPDSVRLFAAFNQVLEGRGFVEGRNVTYEIRYGQGDVRRYPALAKELVASNVDVFVTTASAPAVRALQEAGPNIPIVFIGISDPLGQGLVQSLARPGGNVTGVANHATDLVPRRIQLLKAAVPTAKRIAIVRGNFGTFDPAATDAMIRLQDDAARAAAVTLTRVWLNTREELAAALASVERERPDAVILNPNSLNFILRRDLGEFGLRARLPIMAPAREFVTSGALASYGSSEEDSFRKAAGYVDRILRGAKPSDLAVEFPTVFELVVNMKTAKALGLTLPQSFLVQVTERIE